MLRHAPRLVAALFAVALSLGLAVNPMLAANTRTVFFGSPGTTTQSNGLGILTTTPVTVGSDTAFDVELQNLSPSQLTHVLIQGGAAAPDPLANTTYPAPSPICPTGATVSTDCLPSLPPGTTYIASYVSPASTVPASCSLTSTSLNCSVSNMGPKAVVIIRVVLLPPAQVTTTNIQFWLAASLKEGTSSTGSNQDTFFSYGDFSVVAADCTHVSNFFLQNQPVSLSNTTAGGCDQATNIATNATFSNGAFSQVGAVAGSFCAPGITTCFGQLSQANVNGGQQPSGTYVQWDIVWSGADLPTAKPSGVTHFLDGYDPVSNKNAFVTIYFKPKYQCSASLTVNCWVTTNSTKTSFEAIIRTPNNGYVRGF